MGKLKTFGTFISPRTLPAVFECLKVAWPQANLAILPRRYGDSANLADQSTYLRTLRMKNVDLNIGGLIGALAAGGIAAAIVFPMIDRKTIHGGRIS
jgi:hypothetical protein